MSFFAIPIAIVLWAFLYLSVGAFFLLWAARLMGIRDRSFPRALGAVFLGGIVGGLAQGALYPSAIFLTPGVPALAGFAAQAVVTMLIFRTTFWRAVGTNFISWLLTVLVMGMLILLFVLLFGGIALGLSSCG